MSDGRASDTLQRLPLWVLWTLVMVGSGCITAVLWLAGVPHVAMGGPRLPWLLFLGAPAAVGQTYLIRTAFGATRRQAVVWGVVTAVASVLALVAALLTAVMLAWIGILSFPISREPVSDTPPNATISFGIYALAGIGAGTAGGLVVGVAQRAVGRQLPTFPASWSAISTAGGTALGAGAVLVLIGARQWENQPALVGVALVTGCLLYGMVTGAALTAALGGQLPVSWRAPGHAE